MPKKSVREMTFFERMHYSLGAKMFHAVIIVTALISAAAIAFGFYLYGNAVQREYRIQAWHTAKTAEALIDHELATEKLTEIMTIYQANADIEEPDEAYIGKFEGVMDDKFKSLKDVLHSIEQENDASSVYIGVIDLARSRFVYLVDSDYSEMFCPPGYWDELSAEEVDIYMNGAPVSTINKLLGDDEAIPAMLSRSPEFGFLCTAADALYQDDRYIVVAAADLSMEHVVGASRRFLLQYVLILLVLGIIIALLFTRYLKKNVTGPINELAEAARAYSMDKLNANSSGKHFERLNIKTGDEIENLSLTMKDMENDLAEYVENLTKVTAEKERINTELDVGKQIQEGVLPHIFPAFPERQEFDVYASMDTAKEVGGDFYDFFLIDDDHLAVVMADVSGKGIPAALFMMASKILIGNISKIEKESPGKILSIVNEQICSNNPAEMFVTVWLGILEISTGKLRAANAGHEYPVIRRGNGDFELYKDKHGLVVGGMDGMVYSEYEIDMNPGDALFQYTDGVTEATNINNELYGTERMVVALNKYKNESPKTILEGMKKSVDDFVNEAPQFDDITMLCLEYKGK